MGMSEFEREWMKMKLNEYEWGRMSKMSMSGWMTLNVPDIGACNTHDPRKGLHRHLQNHLTRTIPSQEPTPTAPTNRLRANLYRSNRKCDHTVWGIGHDTRTTCLLASTNPYHSHETHHYSMQTNQAMHNGWGRDLNDDPWKCVANRRWVCIRTKHVHPCPQDRVETCLDSPCLLWPHSQWKSPGLQWPALVFRSKLLEQGNFGNTFSKGINI